MVHGKEAEKVDLMDQIQDLREAMEDQEFQFQTDRNAFDASRAEV